MPVCVNCHRMLPSAEVRKLPKGGWRCKDKYHCKPRTVREDAQATEGKVI